jgi:hypothetical protein
MVDGTAPPRQTAALRRLVVLTLGILLASGMLLAWLGSVSMRQLATESDVGGGSDITSALPEVYVVRIRGTSSAAFSSCCFGLPAC